LRRLGHQADLILPRESAERRLWCKVLALPGRVPETLRLGRQIRSGGYDIVHVHVANAGWMATLGGYPYVVHCHGSEIRPGLSQPGRRQLALYTLRRAEHVFYVTPDLYAHLRPYRPDATLLPNPVDTEHFCPAQRPTVGDGPVRVLIAIPLTLVKHPEPAYEAVAALQALTDSGAMTVAALGFGKHIAAYGHLLGRKGIQYLDPRPYDTMAALYNDYDVIIGQLQIGSLGMIELEAMACGKPVITLCDLDSYALAYGEAPPVLSANTAAQIAAHLRDLAEHPARRASLGQQARAWVERHHSFEAIGQRLVAQYGRVLATRKYNSSTGKSKP
jgi:glycosyltransferase involved in cell wall biosynthesis